MDTVSVSAVVHLVQSVELRLVGRIVGGRRGDGGRPVIAGGRCEAVAVLCGGAGASRSSKKWFTYVQRHALVQWLAFALLEGAQQQFTHPFAEIATEEGVQQWIDARIEVRDEKREWREERIEVRVTLVRVGPESKYEHFV